MTTGLGPERATHTKKAKYYTFTLLEKMLFDKSLILNKFLVVQMTLQKKMIQNG